MGSASERIGMGWQLHTEALVAADRHSWCDCHEVATSHLFDAERVDPAEDVLRKLSHGGVKSVVQANSKLSKRRPCLIFSMDASPSKKRNVVFFSQHFPSINFQTLS